jgi:hypothetical protein
MQRFLSALLTASLVAALGTAAVATDKSKMKAMSTPKPSAMSMSKPMKCGKGKSYVKGYTKKNGTVVKGYCR